MSEQQVALAQPPGASPGAAPGAAPGVTPGASPGAAHTFLEELARAGMANAARGLSVFVGEPIAIAPPRVARVSLYDLPALCGGPGAECIGVYLLVEGDLPGHVMLLLSRDHALDLARLLMVDLGEDSAGLGALERSALAEVGNLTASLFLNAVAALTGASARPSPPAVLEDMAGAILDVVVVASALKADGAAGDEVLVLGTTFQRGERQVEALFWVIPDDGPLRALVARCGEAAP